MVGIDDLLVILVTSHTGVITTKTMAPVALKVHQTIKYNTRMAKNNKMQVGGGGRGGFSLYGGVEIGQHQNSTTSVLLHPNVQVKARHRVAERVEIRIPTLDYYTYYTLHTYYNYYVPMTATDF